MPEVTQPETFDVSKFFDFGPTGREAYNQAATGGLVPREAANIAFRTRYGTDAPDWAIPKAGDHVADSFWDRVMRGDFARTGSDIHSPGTKEGSYLRQSAEELARQQNIKAVRPAAESMAAELPEISKRFASERERLAAEKDPLTARYDNLIAQITGRQKAAVDRQTMATSNELGRRGIAGGLAEQSIASAVNPLETEFSSVLKDTGFEREKGLRDIQNAISQLIFGETDARRGVQNAIAQMISQASLGGLDRGSGNYQFDIGADLNKDRLSIEKNQADIANKLAERAQKLSERQFNEIELPKSKAASAGGSLGDLWGMFGL